MKATVTNTETGEVIETMNNVVGLWNGNKTIEYTVWGETFFWHLDDDEAMAIEPK